MALGLAAPFMLSSSHPDAEIQTEEQKIALKVPEGPLMIDPSAQYLGRGQYEAFNTQVIEASYDAPVLVYFGADWDAKFNKNELIPEIQKIYAPFIESGWKYEFFDIEDGKKTLVPDEHGRAGRDWTEALGVNGVPYMMFVYKGAARRLPETRIDNVEKFLAGAIHALTPEGQPRLTTQATPPRYNSIYHSPFNYPRSF